MPPRLQVTPDVEDNSDELDIIYREHYFTRQRRREEGRDRSNDKRRAENVIRKNVKENKKAREEEKGKGKEGEQRVAEQLNQRTQESLGKEKAQMACESPESENSESVEPNKAGKEKRKAVLFPASFEEQVQVQPANIGQSKAISENVVTDGAPSSATTTLDTSTPDLSQRRSQEKHRGGVSEVRLSTKKRQRAETSDDTVQELAATPLAMTKRTRVHKDTPRPVNNVDSNASESEESLERMVRDTRRYLTMALNNLERIDFEERRLRNEERKLLLEERRIIALEDLTKGNSK